MVKGNLRAVVWKHKQGMKKCTDHWQMVSIMRNMENLKKSVSCYSQQCAHGLHQHKGQYG